MNKEYKIKLDLNKKLYNKKMAFNQFDKNVNDFYIEVTKNNEVVKDLDKSIITLVAIKPNNAVDAQFIEVKEGQIYADLKPSMCDLVGNYQAKAMIVLEGEIVTTDTINYSVSEDKIISRLNDDVVSDERFPLFTDALARLSTIEISEEQRVINEAERILSEENRKIEESKRVEAELVRQHEEADRTKYDATRESNENIRKINEEARISSENVRLENEANRIEQETNRVKAEQLRKDNYNFMTEDEERRRLEANAHKEAEVLRVQAETNRVNEEAKRRTTEQARVLAENTRVSNENTRKANEETRQNNETHRVEAETQRQSRYNSFIADAEANANNFENYTNTAKVKEEERKSNELNRKSQEDRRVSNEVERISNENTRKANEKAREKNETSRQNIFENKVSEVDEKIVELDTTKDNFISSINTKVDNKISEIDNAKDNFVASINTKVDTKISEIEVAKSDMTNTVSNKINEVETRFNALTSSQQQDAEVIDARDGETSLKARLDRDIEKAKQVYECVEGSNISTDSSSGYLKDVEILGNTIQNASNLADIRSVGDKVEGQELYEIPVLSRGKNLANPNNFEPSSYITSDGFGNYTIVETGTGLFIPLLNNLNLKGSTYIIKVETLSGVYTGGNILFYGLDGIKFGEHTANGLNSTATITTTTGLNAIKLYGVNGNATFRIQISENNITEYEPYQEDKLTILSPVQLEKVGDVRDRIICKDGVLGVEKNVDNIVFNGSEQWQYNSATKEFYLTKSNYIYNSFNGCISDKFVYGETGGSYNNVIKLGNAIFVTLRKDDITNLDDFKVWLQNNNVLVMFITPQPQFIPLPHDQQVKLRTFAGKTNISFLTEIEGTIKAQVPKSLGATVNTHTEQINNLNKELDRVKKLEESTVSTVTTKSDFTTVEQTSNGYFDDVKLEGKTLVNLAKQPTNNGSVNHQYATISTVTNIKHSTEYTYIIRNNGSETLKLYLNTNGGFDWFDLDVEANSTVIGKAKTLPTINGDIWLSLKKAETKEQNLQVVLLEGDHTQNPPSFFEGLKSVGDATDEIVVSSVNENLIDKDKLKSYSSTVFPSIVNNGFEVDFSSVISVPYYEVKGVDSYLNLDIVNIGSEGILIRGYMSIDDLKNASNFVFNKGIVSIGKINELFVPKEVKYIAFHRASANSRVVQIDNISLTTKSISNFTPHQSDKKRLLYYNNETQTWEKPILRQWDSIEKHANGKYYYHQRSGEVVLNGSENWIIDNNNTRFGLYNIESITGNVNVNVEQISDKFSVYDRYGEKIGSFGVGIGFVRIQNNFGFTTANEFKTWLQTNNVTVVYQLAEEKVYECTNIDLITYANETNYIVESGVLSPKTTLKVHNNISNVVSLLQKKVSLLESDMTKYMITQNRLMLASRYNADTVSFKVDVATLRNSFEYDNDLYELILNNILVGKDNYNREYIENLTRFYWMDFVISDEMYSTLFEIIEEQHNPKIEEETPLI